MRIAQASKNPYGRLNHRLQSFHLSRLGNSGFKKSYFASLIQIPYGQRHSDLGIVAPRRTGDVLFRGQQLVKPLLDHGLPITSGYTHHRNVEGLAMTFGQALQSFQRTDHLQEIGIGTGCHVFRQTADHKRAYPPAIKFGNITVPVVATAFQRKKQSIFRETQRTAIR